MGIFLLTLDLNVTVTADDSFIMLSDETVAQTTSTFSSSGSYSGWLWEKSIMKLYVEVLTGQRQNTIQLMSI